MSAFPIRREAECLVVELHGRLTADDHFRFLQTAATLAEDPSGWVVLDFSRVESLEAAAYRGLTHIFQLTLIRGGDVLFVGAKQMVLSALEFSGLAEAVEVFPTADDAIRNFSGRRWW